jgi:hypothetical protein
MKDTPRVEFVDMMRNYKVALKLSMHSMNPDIGLGFPVRNGVYRDLYIYLALDGGETFDSFWMVHGHPFFSNQEKLYNSNEFDLLTR